MLEANDKNTFIGSFVKKNDKMYYVYKVNKLFVWAGKVALKNVLDGWKMKEKGETWIQYMGKIGAEKLTFKGMTIENNDGIIIKKKPTSEKNYLSLCCEKLIAKMMSTKKKTWKYINIYCENCEKIFRILDVKEDGRLLISCDYKLFHFNPATKEYELFRSYLNNEVKEEEPILKEIEAV